jgi:hypothetical protein
VVGVVLEVSVGRHNVILARKGVYSFVSSLGGVVRMLIILFMSSSSVWLVLRGSWDIMVFERLSRARRLRSIVRLRSVNTSLLIVFGQNLLRFFEWCFGWEEVSCYAETFF